ncbi:hypothetical protein L3X38_006186 [Prunus dulcis]|uniref:Uncharacterized protein n=1 Tax=Prunus dulcis TaxID=3755 RepID=A0AAD4ZS65_PRUDU|nr:hypothetical protein L3X38_006186 [Prunus dulcis]
MADSRVSNLKEARRRFCVGKLIKSTPFTDKVEQAAPSKWFTTPFITPFKGDFNPERHLKHFKSAMILYKADDALMCNVFTMTLLRAARDGFYTTRKMGIYSVPFTACIGCTP